MCSTEIAKILLQIEGQAMKDQQKPKPIPKDHTKENIKRLKEIQANCKKREEQQNTRLPLKATADKYSGVKSKVALSLQKTRPSCDSPSLDNYSLATIKIVPSIKQKNNSNKENGDSNTSTRNKQRHDTNIRRVSSLSDLSTKITTEITPSAKRELLKSPSSTQLCAERKPSSHHVGKVPKYLIERKKKWKEEEEKRKRNAPDPSIPPGHTLLSDKERLETLTLLQKNHESLLRQMASLPVRTDTLRLRQRKDEIEKQLAQTEEAIVIFSRPRVLIKHES